MTEEGPDLGMHCHASTELGKGVGAAIDNDVMSSLRSTVVSHHQTSVVLGG